MVHICGNIIYDILIRFGWILIQSTWQLLSVARKPKPFFSQEENGVFHTHFSKKNFNFCFQKIHVIKLMNPPNPLFSVF